LPVVVAIQIVRGVFGVVPLEEPLCLPLRPEVVAVAVAEDQDRRGDHNGGCGLGVSLHVAFAVEAERQGGTVASVD
jgi:hypothetical protein